MKVGKGWGAGYTGGGNEVSLSRTLLRGGLGAEERNFCYFKSNLEANSLTLALCVFRAHCTTWSTVNTVGKSFFFSRRYFYSWLAHSFRLEFSLPDEFSAFEYLWKQPIE